MSNFSFPVIELYKTEICVSRSKDYLQCGEMTCESLAGMMFMGNTYLFLC